VDREIRDKIGQRAVIFSVSGKITLTVFNLLVGISIG
jgi:GMP synthase PP-ATPase subunit